ncbi:MAG: hypothetical protein HLX50_17345 [Alteromonadaceae bacterium]|nr:hypothetical protein [Alteromonadaceae bacterium]
MKESEREKRKEIKKENKKGKKFEEDGSRKRITWLISGQYKVAAVLRRSAVTSRNTEGDLNAREICKRGRQITLE